MPSEPSVKFSPARKAFGACFLAAVLLLCAVGKAQEYSFRSFVGADGLGNLSVQKLFQDRSGFLWVSTENGIFRYDGTRFEAFGPPQGIPVAGGVAFGEAPDGSLLVGASIGLYRFTGRSFTKITAPFTKVNWTQGIQSDGHGKVYLGTELGLFEMTSPPNQAQFAFRRIFPMADGPPQSVNSIFIDGKAIWFGCALSLCRMEAGTVKVFGEADGLLNVPIAAFLKDRAGNIWVRARNEGVLEWPAGEARFRRPDTPVPGRELTGTPALDREGRILIGTPEGLLIGDDAGWRLIDRHVGMRGGVYASFEDRQHSLWMGTGGRGLTQWRGYREWEGYSSQSGLPSDNVYEMLPQADGSIWVGTETGLVKGTPSGLGMTWTTVAASGVSVHSLQMTPSGDLWFGTAGRGVAVLHGSTGQPQWFDKQQGLGGRLAFTIRFDHQQRLWVATEAGLFVSQPPYRSFTRIAELPGTWFWTVTEGADGTIWAGGVDGLFSFASGRWQHWNRDNGLTNQAVVAIGADRDASVWVGYQHGGGIDHVRLTAQVLKVQNGVQRPGSDGLIYFLNFDRSGHLWAGTERGVDVWDGQRWGHYDTTDGLIWDDCDIGGFAQAADGSLWFGTSGGLAHFRPNLQDTVAAGPGVVFTDLRIGQTNILGENHPSFEMSSGAIVASFAAPNANQDSGLLFRYRLEGNKSPWTETAQRQLEFPRLSPGHYDLEVQVRDNRGVWSSQEAAFSFRIATPWYGRGWFLIVLALAPFLGALILFRIRSLGAQKKQRQLQRMVDEKTNDLRVANEELLRLTMMDALTGLANRRHFDQTLSEECERVRRSAATVSLILIDVDHFKALNDSAGHQKGDEYLIVLGQELARTARRQIDLAARIGGEEFALVLPSTDASQALQIAEQLRSHVEALGLPHPASPVAPTLTVSIGVATATPQHYLSPEELVAAADQSLYRAKSGGRNRVEVA